MVENIPDETIRRDLLQHHWEHARWLQDTRNTFFYMYVIVFAGAVTLATRETITLKIVLPFLLLFSTITIIFGVKNGLEFYHHASYAIMIAESFDASKWMSRPLGMYKDDVVRPNFLDPRKLIQGIRNPPMHTSPFMSPGNWALLLAITGFGLTSGWTIIEYTTNLELGGAVAVISVVVLIPFIWYYLDKRTTRIDQHMRIFK